MVQAFGMFLLLIPSLILSLQTTRCYTPLTTLLTVQQIYGPSLHDDYGSNSFPGIDDAIEKAKSLNTSDSWRFVQHEVWRVARVVTQASLVLHGKFT